MTEIRPSVADLAAAIAAAAGNGVQWSLSDVSQLNVNLVHLKPGASIGEHVSHDVDVIIILLSGSAVLGGGDRQIELRAHHLAYLPAGLPRDLRAGQYGAAYLTLHRQRGGLQVGRPR